jgi:hypothetical protein
MNEFGRAALIPSALRFPKFGQGLRLQARAADSLAYTDGVAWRVSQGRLSARPALEGQKNV